MEVALSDSYHDALERWRPWLSPTGGSAESKDFEPIAYKPVLAHAAKTVKL